ncbi:hypothetical protein CDL12_11637 [Handroanthus impetiginosus]|uniref:Uncharacterized protein n=1 Tax=Handroanthus impetiginosus TaxID=429701 RepID=A0A2G9HDV6_9LAMI|nr:hypothetical protein CDL12_11637 [Handroanthus impetiginosus]
MDEFSGSRSQNLEQAHHSVSLNQSANSVAEEGQVNRRLWVGPNRNPITTNSVKKRLVQAVNCLKDTIRDKDVLIQIWIPVKRGSRQVLTTNNQPFSLNPNCKNLADYRDVSENYLFAVDTDSKEFVGLPGRVFLKKLPEWTPDVRFFKREEYPSVNHAQQYDVRGSLALPVFEQGSGICLGVVEIVMTSVKVNYRPELENVCKALEAVDLKSSDIRSPSSIEDRDQTYQGTLAEIKSVLKLLCDTHKLPLAQTWASCVQQSKGGCQHSDENYASCVSTIDLTCYVADPQVSGFHEACSEHHLIKSEGVVGKAFLTNQLCFAEDITAFSKTEYPLAHYARVFNLCASAAIRLRSTYNGTAADFVLEFFLPVDCKDAKDQMLLVDSLSSVIQQTCQCLRVITDQELAQETSGSESGSTSSGRLQGEKHPKLATSPSKESSSWIMSMRHPKEKGKGVAIASGDHKEEPEGEFKAAAQWHNSGLDLHHVPTILEHEQLRHDSGTKRFAEGSGNFSFTIGHYSSGAKKTSSEKRRTKTEKTISLELLRQYFAGSLKEAARSIGVCPTTLKRICRQHGISRWPSRKIKKVGHSLRKLQLVIDSVKGADIQLGSFYNNFPELVSPNVPGSSQLPKPKMSDHMQQENNQPEGTLLSPTASASIAPSSSGSHSSSSSFCYSTGVKQSSLPVAGASHGDALPAEKTEGVLKRAWSVAELQGKEKEETKPLFRRSYSHRIISNQVPTEAQAMQKNSKQEHHVGTFRVKASFGEEKIRLSLPPHWGFKDLQREVLRRFNIDDGSGSITLKYLDDDSEWVLLTCDADLEECTDIHRSSKSRRIKLSVHQAHHPNLGSSFGSNGASYSGF